MRVLPLTLFCSGLALLACPSLAVPELSLPSSGRGPDFLFDYAQVVPPANAQEIRQIQRSVFDEQDIPIVAVTIPLMSEYGYDGDSMGEFARQWFDQWRIGAVQGPNKGILLLVSVGDRKIRIELGAEWGRAKDSYCQRIIDRDLVPNFKEGNFGTGLEQAVISLASMVRADGSDSMLSEEGYESRSLLSGRLPWWLAGGCIVVGLALISLAAYWESREFPHWSKFEPRSRTFIKVGVGLILGGVLGFISLMLLLIAFVVFAPGGGGFGGGSSGGGGAGGGY